VNEYIATKKLTVNTYTNCTRAALKNTKLHYKDVLWVPWNVCW